jgi:hypothetical protein
MAARKRYVPKNPLKPHNILATRMVRFKESGAEGVINARDFDPAVHEDPTTAKGSGTELGALSVAQLKALAEEKGVDLGDAKKKDDIVAALEAAGVTG